MQIKESNTNLRMFFILCSHEIKPHVIMTPRPLPRGLAHSSDGIIRNNVAEQRHWDLEEMVSDG